MQFEIVCVQDELQRFSFNFVQKKSNCSEDLIMFKKLDFLTKTTLEAAFTAEGK